MIRLTAAKAWVAAAVVVAAAWAGWAWWAAGPRPALENVDGGAHLAGIVLEVSGLPDPETLPYRDLALVAKVENVGRFRGRETPREMLVCIQAVADRAPLPAATLRPGDKVELVVSPAARAPETLRTMQRADDIPAFHLELFFASAAHRWEEERFASLVAKYAREGSRAPLEPPAPPEFPDRRTPHDRALRRASLEADITRIREAAARYGGDWQAWSAAVEPWSRDIEAKADANGGFLREDGAFFTSLKDDHYRTLCEAGPEGETITALRSFHQQLDALGIDLLVVPFPRKEEVFAHAFGPGAPADGNFVPWRLRFFLDCLEAGIEIVDLVPPLRAAWAAGDPSPLFYPYGDTHPADGGIRVTADVLANRLARYRVPPILAGLTTERTTYDTVGTRRREYPHMPDDPTFPATLVRDADGDLLRPGGPGAPFVLVGDSFVRVPEGYGREGANLGTHIALHTGVSPDELSIDGAAAEVMRNLAREGPRFLEGRRAVIFVFAAGHLFTHLADGRAERRWRLAPLVPANP